LNRRKPDSLYTSSLEEQNSLLKDYIQQLERITGPGSRPDQISELLSDYDYEDDSGSETSQKDGEIDPADFKLKAAVEHDAISDVSSMLWKLDISGDGTSSFLGPSGNFCYPQSTNSFPLRHEVRDSESVEAIIPPALASDLTGLPSQASQVYNAGKDLMQSQTLELSQEPHLSEETLAIETALLDLFSYHVNSVYHFLDEETMLALASPRQPVLSFSLLRNAVLAVAALFSDDSMVREHRGPDYAEAAAADALRCCREYPAVETVEALAIMCWRELGLENENEAWLYNGMHILQHNLTITII